MGAALTRRTPRRMPSLLSTVALIAGMVAVLVSTADASTSHCKAKNLTQHSKRSSDLQALIDAANAGDTLQIRGTCQNAENFSISTDVALAGKDATAALDGGASGTVLSVESGAEVTLTDLRITNGSGILGGGIFNRGSVTLNGSSSVNGNNSEGDGGGIFNWGGVVVLNGSSSVGGNMAAAFGGGILNYDGASLTLNDFSSVSANTGGLGGGILSYVNSTLTINNSSSVSENQALFAGGGIYNNSTLIVNDSSSVSGNTAGRGAGIVNEGARATVTLNDSSLVVGNEAVSVGGGIENRSGTVTLNDTSSVTGNTAPGGGGGILNFSGAAVIFASDWTGTVCGNDPDDWPGCST